MADYEGTTGDDIHYGTPEGDQLEGHEGNDQLHGEGGGDFLFGSYGEDQLYGGDGHDQLVAGPGNDLLIGGGGHDRLDGSLGDDVLIGGSGNDLLLGRHGVDRYDGGDNDGLDQIYGTTFGDQVGFFMEDATQGVFADLRTGVAIDGFGNRETMTGIESLTRGSAFADEMRGSDVANSLGGGVGDTMMGFGGDDYLFLDGAAALLDGGAGIDTLISFDTKKYVPDLDGDGRADIVEAYQGVTIDLARNLVIDAFGDTGTITGVENVGGSLNYYDDRLFGDGNANVIRGLGGGDYIDGRGGRDTVDYSQAGHHGLHAVIVDLAAGYSEDVVVYQVPDEPGGPRYGSDTLLNIENVIGTGRDDRLLGDANANLIAPGAGNDVVNGRGGVDTVDYSGVRTAMNVNLSASLAIQAGTGAGPVYWNGSSDVRIEADDAERSRDRLYGIENVIGSTHGDRMTGDDGPNRLDGGRGDDVFALSGGGDTLIGGAGYDTVDYSAATGAVTIDFAGGAASVAGSPDADRLLAIENAVGSAFGDRLTGNSRHNRLDGGGGADRMEGGAGNDVYVVDDRLDVAVEAAGGGVDRVESAVSLSLRANIENLTLAGDAVAGNGNALANRMIGNGGANRLDGRAGADTMVGGDGNDLYIADHIGDRAIESGGEGVDRVQSSVDFALVTSVENLVLTGAGDITGTGNSLANIIRGNIGENVLDGGTGDDRLDGGAGDDSLYGGRGSDTLVSGTGSDGFYFDTLLRAAEADAILDFSAVDDSLYLSRAVFGGIEGDGQLADDAFRAGTAAQDSSDRILYDRASGDIFYDADGTGAARVILFAHVAPGSELSAADFIAYG